MNNEMISTLIAISETMVFYTKKVFREIWRGLEL